MAVEEEDTGVGVDTVMGEDTEQKYAPMMGLLLPPELKRLTAQASSESSPTCKGDEDCISPLDNITHAPRSLSSATSHCETTTTWSETRHRLI